MRGKHSTPRRKSKRPATAPSQHETPKLNGISAKAVRLFRVGVYLNEAEARKHINKLKVRHLMPSIRHLDEVCIWFFIERPEKKGGKR